MIGYNCRRFINWVKNPFMRTFLFLSFLVFSTIAQSQNMTAKELLNMSIQFHDPIGKWGTCQMELVISSETPTRPTRNSLVTINNDERTFTLKYVSHGHLLEYQVDGRDSATVFSNFMEATGKTDIDSLDLSANRARRWRNYYSYLYGLPMKLKDSGTNIDPKVIEDNFNGEDVLAIRVTYEAEVGNDTWYFYFHPNTYALVGYRFYHDENINDGEYIVLDGMAIQNGLRIPKNRYWYINEDARFLGADMLMSLKVSD